MMAVDPKKIAAGVGAGLAAAAGAAAGYYFYASKDASKHRRLAARWAKDLKYDVLKQSKKMGKLDRKKIVGIIDTAVAAYENIRGLDSVDLKRAAHELKQNWDRLRDEAAKGARRAARASAPVPRSRAKKGRGKHPRRPTKR